jgi:hypothetical protein
LKLASSTDRACSISARSLRPAGRMGDP